MYLQIHRGNVLDKLLVTAVLTVGAVSLLSASPKPVAIPTHTVERIVERVVDTPAAKHVDKVKVAHHAAHGHKHHKSHKKGHHGRVTQGSVVLVFVVRL
jgi:hypothetical protein